MTSELSGIKNESQISWFGFSAASFSDCVFNAFVDAWKETCDVEFQTSLKELGDKERLRFLTFPFQTPSIEESFQVMKRYCVSDIFKIPLSVTLPECQKMHEAAASNPKSQTQTEKDFAAKLEKIRQLRIQLAARQSQTEALNESIEVLHAMEKGQEQLIRQNQSVPESPTRMSPV